MHPVDFARRNEARLNRLMDKQLTTAIDRLNRDRGDKEFYQGVATNARGALDIARRGGVVLASGLGSLGMNTVSGIGSLGMNTVSGIGSVGVNAGNWAARMYQAHSKRQRRLQRQERILNSQRAATAARPAPITADLMRKLVDDAYKRGVDSTRPPPPSTYEQFRSGVRDFSEGVSGVARSVAGAAGALGEDMAELGINRDNVSAAARGVAGAVGSAAQSAAAVAGSAAEKLAAGVRSGYQAVGNLMMSGQQAAMGGIPVAPPPPPQPGLIRAPDVAGVVEPIDEINAMIEALQANPEL
jgi:hypothetical protein